MQVPKYSKPLHLTIEVESWNCSV